MPQGEHLGDIVAGIAEAGLLPVDDGRHLAPAEQVVEDVDVALAETNGDAPGDLLAEDREGAAEDGSVGAGKRSMRPAMTSISERVAAEAEAGTARTSSRPRARQSRAWMRATMAA